MHDIANVRKYCDVSAMIISACHSMGTYHHDNVVGNIRWPAQSRKARDLLNYFTARPYRTSYPAVALVAAAVATIRVVASKLKRGTPGMLRAM